MCGGAAVSPTGARGCVQYKFERAVNSTQRVEAFTGCKRQGVCWKSEVASVFPAFVDQAGTCALGRNSPVEG